MLTKNTVDYSDRCRLIKDKINKTVVNKAWAMSMFIIQQTENKILPRSLFLDNCKTRKRSRIFSIVIALLLHFYELY